MDIDQSARRQARDEFQVIDPDYYDMEGLYIRTNDCIMELVIKKRVIPIDYCLYSNVQQR
jgi:hypothetical protein